MDPSFLTAQIEGMEWIILLIVIAALFMFGPSKIPELARGFGLAVGEFRRGREQVDAEIRKEFGAVKDDLKVPDVKLEK